ncbi:MAG: GHKL domain-containing protein [Clostridiales bacterium]|nr:GHKL domain-containing protein [Clostridiales bacterium]
MAIRVCFYMIYLIEGFIFFQYCSTLFVSQYANWINVLSLLILYAVLAFFSVFSQPVINIVSFFCINFIYLRFLYQVKWHEALFHSALSTATMFLGEIIIIYISPYELSYSFSSWASFRIWIIPCIFEKIIYFTLMMIFAHFSVKLKNKETIFNRSSLYIAATPVISIYIMYTFLTLRKECDLSPVLYSLIAGSAILLLVLNILTWEIYNYNTRRNAEFMELQLLHQKESDTLDYYKMLIQQNENQNQLIHDTKKHLQSIAILNHKGEQEKITAYVDSILNSSALKVSARICSNEFLNAVLCRYVGTCQQMGIDFRADIRNKSIDFLKEDDITSLFCNLLDNAVEAASYMQDGIIELSSYRQESTSFAVVTLANSCRKNPLKENDQLASKKPNKLKHGYGLKIIRRIVNDYEGEIQHYYSDEEHFFHTIIILKPHSS